MDWIKEHDNFINKRRKQQKKWMWRQITEELLYRLKTDPGVKEIVPKYEDLVASEQITSGQAAEEILQMFMSRTHQ